MTNAYAQKVDGPGIPGINPPSGVLAPNILGSGHPGLTLSVRRQIAAIQADKRSWRAGELKMASPLVYAAKRARKETIPGAPLPQARAVQTDIAGRARVEMKAAITPSLLRAIQRTGATIEYSSPRFGLVRAWIGVTWLETFATRPDVVFVGLPNKRINRSGATISDGDYAHGSHLVRNGNPLIDGRGTKVGVISDSDDFVETSVATGEIAGPVQTLPGQSGRPASGEGTAMLEIIADVAPGASLAFATAGNSPAEMAQNILDLAAAGCTIIVDDIGWLLAPRFQDDVVANAIDTVAAMGVVYLSATGNDGNFITNTSSTWEGDFVDDGTGLHVFNDNLATGYANFMIGNSPTLAILTWSDPAGSQSTAFPPVGSANDYDLFILNSSATTLVDLSNNVQNGRQDPLELALIYPYERAVVVRTNGQSRQINLWGFGLPWFDQTVGNTYGHPNARGAVGVAAVDAFDLRTPFFGWELPEYYSSDGPKRVFYNYDGTPVTPFNFLGDTGGGEVRYSPSVAGADNVRTSVPGFELFPGTSAAAPHVAAIAALARSARPLLTRDEVVRLLNTQVATFNVGWDPALGNGIVMANKVVDAVVNLIAPALTITNLQPDRVSVSWGTTLPANEVSELYDDTNSLIATQSDSVANLAHGTTFTGLTAGKTYTVRVRSTTPTASASGNASIAFTTPAPTPVSIPDIRTTSVTVRYDVMTATFRGTITLRNQTDRTATQVRLTQVVLGGSPAFEAVPIAVSDIPAGGTATVNVTFGSQFPPGMIARIRGAYVLGSTAGQFSDNLFVIRL